MFNLFKLIMLASSGNIPSALYDNNQSIDKVVSWLGGNDLSSNGQVVRFYYNWYGILHPHMLWIDKLGGWINDVFTLGLYHTAQAFESVFMAILHLFGFFSPDTFYTGEMGTLYKVIVGLGFAMLVIGLSYLLVENIFRAKTKLHEVVTNIIVVIAVVIMLPYGTSLFSQFVTAGSDDLVGSSNPKMESIAAMPIRMNVLDTLSLASTKFKTDPQEVASNIYNYNDLTDDAISHLDFSNVIASNALRANSIPKGVDNVFKHTIQSGVPNNKHATWQLDDATLPNSQTQLTKIMDPVYPRYVGHFIIADLQLALIVAMFAIIAFRVGKSWFEILMLNAAAPIMGFQDLRSTQRLKEVMQAIEGSFVGIFAELIGLRLFLIVLNYLSLPKNPGIKFLSHYPNSAVPIGFFLIIMYLASFIAFMSGVKMIERWTGVPQSKTGTAVGALLGIGAAGAGLAVGAKGIGKVREGMKGAYQKTTNAFKGSGGGTSTPPDPTKAVPNGKKQQTTSQMPTTGKPETARDDQQQSPYDIKQPVPDTNTDDRATSAGSSTDDVVSDPTTDKRSSEAPVPDPTKDADTGQDNQLEEPLPDPTAGIGLNKQPDGTSNKETDANAGDSLPDPTTGSWPEQPDSSPVSNESKDSPDTSVPNPAMATGRHSVTGGSATPNQPETPLLNETSLEHSDWASNPNSNPTVPTDSTGSAPTNATPDIGADNREDSDNQFNPLDVETDPTSSDDGLNNTPLDTEDSATSTPAKPAEPVQSQSSSSSNPTSSASKDKESTDKEHKKSDSTKKLISRGAAVAAFAREQANDDKSMVNLPETKIDDSIY